jgi:peptidoglycan/LPS O-acetylase OafA/YrhL
MKHVPSLDGIRAISILIVIGFHLGVLGFGWAGVQIFFVLSGYLITGILLEDRERYSLTPYLKRFYWRRSLRIFPVYYGYLLVLALAQRLFGVAPEIAGSWLPLSTYTMDFARMNPVDPGGHWAVHLWSLAVEEQFYLVWPWVVFFLSRHSLSRVAIGLVIAGPLIRLATAMLVPPFTGAYVGRVVYVSPFSQVDAFAAGAAIAILPWAAIRRPGRWFAGAVVVLAVLGLWNFTQFDRSEISIRTLGYPVHSTTNFQHVWGYTAINLVAAFAVLASVRGRAITSLLEHPFMQRIGRVSYGIYVFHYPALLLVIPLRERYSTPVFTGISLAYLLGVWAIAEASYRFYETRFLAMKDRYRPAPDRASAREPALSSAPSIVP